MLHRARLRADQKLLAHVVEDDHAVAGGGEHKIFPN